MPSRRQVLGATGTTVASLAAGCSAIKHPDVQVSNTAHLQRTLTVRISEVVDGLEPTDSRTSTPAAVEPYVFDRRLALESDVQRTFDGVFEDRRHYAATVTTGDASRTTGFVASGGVYLRITVGDDGLTVDAVSA